MQGLNAVVLKAFAYRIAHGLIGVFMHDADPLPRRRQEGDLGVGAARLGALQRQGALQHLPRAHRRPAALHRRPVPQHRRRRRRRPTSTRCRARSRRWCSRAQSIDELALTDDGASELGRFLVTRETKDLGAFKTPQLRNVALTAPYMHDGSEKTLRDVIEFYDRGGEQQPVPRRRHAPAGAHGPGEGGSRRAAGDLHEQRPRALRRPREAGLAVDLEGPHVPQRHDPQGDRACASPSAPPRTRRQIQSLYNCDRRHFLRTSLKFAGMAAAAGIVPAHTASSW